MNIFLIIILAILLGNYLLSLIVETLNVKHASPVLPKELEGYYDSEKYRKSQSYLKENTRFELITDTIFLIIIIFFILIGGFNTVDKFARSFSYGDIITGLIFTGILLFGYQILSIPFSAYDTFIIEEKYGFNRTTIKTFFLDIVKHLILAVIVGAPILSIILWFFNKFGTIAWIYSWLAAVIFMILIEFIAPVLILPIFNKFIPLEEGELKKSLEEYASSQSFKMKGVFKMDGSKRSSKSNAFFVGFGKYRRIVLFDTLIEKHSVDELVSVLAHEMGHYKKKHILKNMIISILTTGLMFYILSVFMNNKELFLAFRMENLSIYASFVFFGFLFTPINMFLSVIGNVLSRKYEYESDAYAVVTYKKPQAFINALKKLSVDNLSNLTPHPLKVFLQYSHPPVLKRIEAIKEIKT